VSQGHLNIDASILNDSIDPNHEGGKALRARLAAFSVIALLVGVAAGEADRIFGRGGNDTLSSGAGADFLIGGVGRDRSNGGAGRDRVAAESDDSIDRISCGSGADVVTADLDDDVAADCELVSRRLSDDPYTTSTSRHKNAVEPDSFTFGHTTVAAYQVARRRNGGAVNIGFAVSSDDGQRSPSGLLPGLSRTSTPPGPADRVTDPAVAYDSEHRLWLIAALGAGKQTTRITVSRSPDGTTWSAPIVAAQATSERGPALDKDWIVCDNGRTSWFRGRCYLAYIDKMRDPRGISLRTTSDGGATWSGPVRVSLSETTGAFPVVRPSGELAICLPR
jgi:hypothetical protein